MKNLFLTLSFAAAASLAVQVQAGPVPAGWKIIKDNGKGKCQLAVPADWAPVMFMGAPMGSANSPDKKSSAVVNEVELPFAQSKEIILGSLKATKMIEDSANKHYFEFTGVGAKPGNLNLYIGIKNGGDICNAQISVPKSQADMAKKIVDSLSPT
jgi:hypothetical protein